MAFCPECGAQIQQGIKFCSKCGAQLIKENDDFETQYSKQERMERHRVFNVKLEAKRVYDYFMEKKSWFDELVALTIERNNAKLPRRWFALWLFPIWGCAFMLDKGGTTEVIGWILEAFFIVMFIVGIIRRKKKKDDLDVRFAEIEIRSTALCNMIADYYDQYEDCPIGIDYIWPQDLTFITSCIMEGRADSFKEALNLLHHKWEVEEQNEKLAIIERNSRMAADEASEANRKAGIAAFCSAMTLYEVSKYDN